MLFPHCPCLSCSLVLAFLSLGRTSRSACFSSIAHVCLAHFFSPSCLQQIVRPFIPFLTTHITLSACSPINRFGMRAFFKHRMAVNHSLFQGQG
ncbi:hypothetical protein DFH08DRAFT_860702, partial [Mycena albidolilacea]